MALPVHSSSACRGGPTRLSSHRSGRPNKDAAGYTVLDHLLRVELRQLEPEPELSCRRGKAAAQLPDHFGILPGASKGTCGLTPDQWYPFGLLVGLP